jgi:Uma2 family endonuclease
VVPEQRVQVKATRFRVPDISVLAGSAPAGPILVEPHFLCIEILSRNDRMEEMQERIDDYLSFGVRYVWLIHPRTRRAFVYTSERVPGSERRRSAHRRPGYLRSLGGT